MCLACAIGRTAAFIATSPAAFCLPTGAGTSGTCAAVLENDAAPESVRRIDAALVRVGTRRFAALCPRYNLIARFGGHGARLRGGPRKWNAERECRAMAKLALNPDLAAVRRRRDFYGERTGWVRPDDGLLVRDLNG